MPEISAYELNLLIIMDQDLIARLFCKFSQLVQKKLLKQNFQTFDYC